VKKQHQNNSDTTAISIVKHKNRKPKHGLYIEISFNSLDGRTRLAKDVNAIMSRYRDYVIACIGQSNIVIEGLIREIAVKEYKLAQYESFMLLNPKEPMADHYIPLSNSKRLDVAKLEESIKEMAKNKRGPSLQDYINNLTEVKDNGDQERD